MTKLVGQMVSLYGSRLAVPRNQTRLWGLVAKVLSLLDPTRKTQKLHLIQNLPLIFGFQSLNGIHLAALLFPTLPRHLVALPSIFSKPLGGMLNSVAIITSKCRLQGNRDTLDYSRDIVPQEHM